MSGARALRSPIVTFGLTLAFVAYAGADDSSRFDSLHRYLAASLDTLDVALADLARTPAVPAFRNARRAFKRIEGLASVYSPTLIAALNSAETQALDEDPAAGYKVVRGFQLLEPAIFDATDRRDLSQEIANMRLTARRMRPVIPLIAPTDAELVDMARLELARVATLGIAGFDAPESGDGIVESADAIEGVERALAASGLRDDRLSRAFDDVVTYLRTHADFESFDRLEFVRDHASRAFRALAARHVSETLPHRRVWPDDVASVYDVRHFNVMAFAAADAPRPTAEWTGLGRDLFLDVNLSPQGTRSCATCHRPDHAFTDGLPRAVSANPHVATLNRRTPTLLNAAMQPVQFADGHRMTIEEQIGDVLASPTEMGNPIDSVVSRLRGNAYYRQRFAAVGQAVTSRALRAAIATYVRSLTRFDSRFDRAVRGELELTADERAGFNLFMGKAQCGTCHFAPLFNGTLPPTFVTSDPEVIGVPARPDASRPTIDPDLGRGAVDRREGLLHAFKTPTVRNAALSGPYMHNGVFRTLDEVIDFYAHGGGAGLGMPLLNQTLSARPLQLNTDERRRLIAFIGSLSDTTDLKTSRPLRVLSHTGLLR